VATPEEIVTAMLQGVGVKPSDVVYDLGSGDGRIVIAAAKRFGARAVGIELDPALVQKSRDAAYYAGVADRATFIWKDIFEVDLSPATVVTVYLFPEVNARLLPKFQRELRPGTRIVSHQYPIGDWKPDRWTQVPSNVRTHTLLFWTVPGR
jgi:cyclopropane fatty-acyl-phospholipid synthase-like methyltransferase